MELNKVSDTFSATGQIWPDQVADIAKQGFKTIINCRPDNEGGSEQPSSETLRAAAEKLCLRYYHIPVVPNAITDADVKQFARALTEAPSPMLGFCRTGNRASALYQKAAGGNQSKGLLAWLKSKCLLRRLCQWCKQKCQP